MCPPCLFHHHSRIHGWKRSHTPTTSPLWWEVATDPATPCCCWWMRLGDLYPGVGGLFQFRRSHWSAPSRGFPEQALLLKREMIVIFLINVVGYGLLLALDAPHVTSVNIIIIWLTIGLFYWLFIVSMCNGISHAFFYLRSGSLWWLAFWRCRIQDLEIYHRRFEFKILKFITTAMTKFFFWDIWQCVASHFANVCTQWDTTYNGNVAQGSNGRKKGWEKNREKDDDRIWCGHFLT